MTDDQQKPRHASPDQGSSAPVEPVNPFASPHAFAPPTAPSRDPGPVPASAPPPGAVLLPTPAAFPYPGDRGAGPPAYPTGSSALSDPAEGPDGVAQGTRRARRRVGTAWLVPIILVAALVGAGSAILTDRVLGSGSHLADAGLAAPVITAAPERAPGSIAGLAATVLPSVVSIQVTTAAGVSTGSGMVLRADGYILTNNHVVAEAAATGAAIDVLFSDGVQGQATLVGRTPDYDLAVIKVDRSGLTPLVLGNSDLVVVGDPVIAIGAPLGLRGTVTTGIVSAMNRPVSAGDTGDTAFINAIQTDAAINPGNSGGPLINASGEVIGINSAIAQPPGASGGASGSIGLGFAIPSNQARRTAEELITTGKATYPVVGVLLDKAYRGEGVRVADTAAGGQAPVSVGGPADRAGIVPGDVILAIDGRPVTEPDELIVAIRAKAPGDTVVLRVRTSTGSRDLRLVLQVATSG
jgi:putative serine protease PepD